MSVWSTFKSQWELKTDTPYYQIPVDDIIEIFQIIQFVVILVNNSNPVVGKHLVGCDK